MWSLTITTYLMANNETILSTVWNVITSLNYILFSNCYFSLCFHFALMCFHCIVKSNFFSHKICMVNVKFLNSSKVSLTYQPLYNNLHISHCVNVHNSPVKITLLVFLSKRNLPTARHKKMSWRKKHNLVYISNSQLDSVLKIGSLYLIMSRQLWLNFFPSKQIISIYCSLLHVNLFL